MRFENIQTKEDLRNFFISRGFEIQKHDETLIKIDNLPHFLKIEYVEGLDFKKAEQIRKKLINLRNVPYQLLVDKTFQKFIFQRDYGTPLRFSYDKTKHYARETEGSIFKKLNLLKFENSDFNTSINNLFDVKEIVNKFYDEYKRIRKKLSNAIKNLDEDSELYAQIIMDRIIFLYFLQTKGILPKTFLSDLYYNKKKSENFYRDYLIPLFFQMLNTEKHSKELLNKFKALSPKLDKIPYLNGGLFSPKEIEIKNGEIQISDSVWDHVFKLLNGYEWVIEEDKGDSTTLTPSILGHIYEKSVIAATQKETGSYYTPEEITTYISKNTIYPYITDRVNEKFNKKYKNIWKELLNKTQHTKEELEQVRFIYFDVLKNLKICDNACGSGAFLIAAQQILLPIYWACIKILLNKPFFRDELANLNKYRNWNYYLKREIITKNLYGVDIQEGAVEIAKLRLWLSMVSEMELKAEDIEPLPNIDYNLLAGNSLIGYIKLPERWGSTLFDDPKKIKTLLEERQKLINIYRDTRSSIEAKQLEKDVEKINKKIRDELDDTLFNEFKAKGIKITKEEFKNLKPFHWGFEFYDVFNGHKSDDERGFDVIIGNPPYLSNKKLKLIEKNIFKKYYRSITGVMNTFVLFTERAITLCYNYALIGLIIHKNIIRSPYYSLIRKYILDNTFIKEIIDVGPGAFQFVTGETIIFILKNRKDLNKKTKITTNFFNEEVFSTSDLKIKFLDQNIFLKQEGYNFNIYISEDEVSIKNKILENCSFLLGNLCEVKTCIATGNDKKYISSNQLNKKYKKTLRGKDIDKYQINYAGLYVLYDPKILHRSREERIFLAPEKTIIRTVSSGIIATYDNNNFYPLSTCISIIPKNNVSMKIVTLLLNSKLINFYYDVVFNLGAHLTTEISVGNIEKLPIKLPQNQQPFITLCNYMLFLNKTEARRKSEKELIEFIDKQIIDSLVYELYFKEELKTNLLPLIKPYLKDIENLKSDDEKLRTIKQIVEKIKFDDKIMREIKKIKSHRWVRIIEGKENGSV